MLPSNGMFIIQLKIYFLIFCKVNYCIKVNYGLMFYNKHYLYIIYKNKIFKRKIEGLLNCY